MFSARRPSPCVLLLLLVAAACLPARAAEGPWVEVRSPHFTVLTDAGEKQGREVALRFEQMRHVFGTLFERARINMPVPLVVVAFRSQGEIKQVLPLWKGKPVEDAGYYQPGPDRDYIALDLSAEDVWHVVFHEYAHLLLRGNYPTTQPWFDEGFAEYYATIELTGKQVVVGKMPEGYGELLGSHAHMPLADLFNVAHDSSAYNESGSRRNLFYAQSWLVVHYLIDKKQMAQAGQYFDLVMNQHMPVADAIPRAFGMDAKHLGDAVDDYSRSAGAKAYIFDLPPLASAGDYSFRKLDALAGQAALADLKLHLRDHFDEGVSELEAVLQQKPDLAAAHRGLGYAYLRKGDFQRAGQHFQRAAELDPKDPQVLYYAALLMNRESLASGRPIADAGGMQQKLDTALSIDPEFADAWELLAFADLALQDERGALEALKRAIQLSPRDEGYQLNLALFYMQQRRWDDASAILEHLKDSNDSAIATRAVQSLTALDEARVGRTAVTPLAQSSKYPASYDAPQWRPQPGQPAPDVTQPIQKEAEPPPDTRPIQFLKGRLVAVDCSAPPAAIVSIAAGSRVLRLRTPDRSKLVLIGADTFSCDWHDLKVSVNYKAGGSVDGDLVSLELP